MIVAQIKKMAATILTAITIQCHGRKLGPSPWGGNDGVGTEATVVIRIIIT